MIPAILLPIYVDIAYDAGRCIPWATTYDQVKLEEQIKAYDSPPIWDAYMRGREAVRTKGISAALCRKLGEAAVKTMQDIRETADEYTPQPFDDVPAVDPAEAAAVFDEV